MPPPLATFITLVFIALLFWRDTRATPWVTGAVWIPLLWMLVISGKSIALWLKILFDITVDGAVTPDSAVWTVLIVAGGCVLIRRRVSVSRVVRNNVWISVYLFYCFIAVFWSEVPFTSFKHWIAILGHPIMALILLTESDPVHALVILLKRFTYVTIPVSVLLLRYYPQWSRVWDETGFRLQKAGFALEKNSLGVICMISGLFFCWYCLTVWRLPKSKSRWSELFLSVGFLGLVAYLFKGLNCGTALVSLVGGCLIVVALGMPVVNPRYIGTYLLVGAISLVVVEWAFGLKDLLIELLNKDPTLTGRTTFWPELIGFGTDPFFGAGYDSFWEGERLKALWSKYWWKPTEAHNGYVETYLNLGLFGLSLLLAVMGSAFGRIRRLLLTNFDLGRLQLGFLAATTLYNWSEAGFKTLSPVFLILFIVSMRYPRAVLVARHSYQPAATIGRGSDLALPISG